MIATVLASTMLLVAAPSPGPVARFRAPERRETDVGHATLRWIAEPPAVRYQVEHALDASFAEAQAWYDGPATQTFVSGLAEGTHRYRVRGASARGDWGPWSAPAVVVVAHASRRLAWTLFTLGGATFACIAAFVAWHARRDARGIADE